MRVSSFAKWLGAAFLLASPLTASAQTYYPSGTYAPEVTRSRLPSGSGTEVALGGGVMNFMGSTAQNATEMGGSWNLRLTFGTRSVLGLEAAYIGSAHRLNVAGLDPDAALVGNGVEGALRLNIPLVTRDGMVEPFALGGIGWSQFDVVNDDFNSSFVRERDRLMTVPLGAGLAMSYRGLMIDGRFTYRMAYRDDLFGGADMRNWIVSANLGSEF
jgi:hypothetical protein